MYVGKMGDIVGSGAVSTGAFSVFVHDLPVATIGSVISPHDSNPVHKAVMVTGSFTVFAEDRPLSKAFDLASCGHLLIPILGNSVEAD
jgi:uncharacterized Zn-binding protein involved in type VI secretion